MLLVEDCTVNDKCYTKNRSSSYKVDLGDNSHQYRSKDNNNPSDEHCNKRLILLSLCFQRLILDELSFISSVGKFILELLDHVPLLEKFIDFFGIGNLLAESLGLFLESFNLCGSKIVCSEFLFVLSELCSILNPLFSSCFIGNLSLKYALCGPQVILSLNLGFLEIFIIVLLLLKIQILSESIKACSELRRSLGICFSLLGSLFILICEFLAKCLLRIHISEQIL